MPGSRISIGATTFSRFRRLIEIALPGVSRRELIIILLIFIIAGLPRLLDLGTFLTADEKNWIGRSYEFIRAFKDFRFNDMLQTTHPGVTTLWTVGVSITAKMLVDHVPFSFSNLVHFVKAAQLPIALLTTLSIPVIYWLLRQLFGKTTAVAAALLIALDPFLIGYSRVAHVDALLAHFVFIAALGLLLYRRQYDQKWLVFSAIMSGLAVLTKVPAIFLIPFFWLVVLTDRRMWSPRHAGAESRTVAPMAGLVRGWSWGALNARLKDFIIWGIIIALMFVIIWPAILWVPNPQGNVLVLKRDIGQAALTPHHMVEDYTVNPTHYPRALLARTTPVILIGNIIALLLFVWRMIRVVRRKEQVVREESDTPLLHTTHYLLLAYVFFFIVMMTLGAKKGDRYILPVWPALAVLAVVGMNYLATLLARWLKRAPHQVAGFLLTIAVLYSGATVIYYHPYTIAYASPLFPDNLSQEVGWGEGLERVAAWLNEIAPQAVVASWYPEELGAYTSAQVAHINAHEQGRVQYIVLYHNMFGRAPDHYANNFIDEYYKKREPIFVAYVAGKEFAWVYDKWVFEGIVGELLPGVHVSQRIPTAAHALYGIDVLPATYSSTINRGDLLVKLFDNNRKLLQEWRTPVTQLEDNGWLTLALPTPQVVEESVTVEISAEGTVPKNAPTIRISRKFDYRPGDIGGTVKNQGDLAVRLRYVISGQQVTEEEGKLLRQLEEN